MRKQVLIFFSIMTLFCLLSFAQTGQTGAIKGTVTFEDGEALPSVAVTLQSPAMVIERMTTITNEKGQFRFLNLAPGKYDLTFELGGMATLIRRDIVVNANLTFDIDVVMIPERIDESLEVVGKAPTIDRQSVTKTAIIDKVFLESLPASRNLSTYFNMTPGITGNSSQGAAIRDNSYNLDGIQMNDPVVGTAPGKIFSVDIMEEISVQSGGLSAEHGSVKGAVVNVVTKSGGNSFSGELTGYLNHEKLKSDNTKGTPLEGHTSGAKYEFEPGLSFGGPIVKDRLWFFMNVSTYRSEHYVAGFPYDKDVETPRMDNTLYPYAKLTYQPSQRDKFILGFNYSNRNINHDGASQYETEDTTTSYKSPSYVISAVWTHTFGSNLLTNLKIGASSKDLDWTVHNQAENYYASDTWLSSNSYGWDDLNPRKRIQMNFDGTLFIDNLAGSHEMKFGLQANMLSGRRQVKTYGPPDSQGFPRVWNYTWDGELYYSEWFAGHDRYVKSLNGGVFFNDTWLVTKSLSLNLGLRFDYNRNYFPAQDGSFGDIPSSGNMAHIGVPEETWDLVLDEAVTAFEWKNLSPRFGIVYDLFSDGKTLIKANLSRYLQDNYTTISFELHPVNWVGYGGYTDADGNLTWLDYTWVPGVNTQVGYKTHDLKAPITTEFIVGIERELWEDWSVGLRYIRRWDRNLIEDVDATVVDIDKLMEEGELVFTDRWQAVETVDPYDGKTLTFYDQLWYEPAKKYMVNPPDLKRDYNGMEFTINKRYSHGWSIYVSYVYNKAEGSLGTSFWQSEGRTGLYNNPNAHTNAFGRVDLERRHQLKVQGVVRGPWGINVSTYFRYLSGRPHDRWVYSRDLGVQMFSDATIRAESRGAYTLPGLAIWDIRLEKDFRFGDHFSTKIFCDVFNALNINTATNVVDYSSSASQTFREMTSIHPPRVFRFGAKFAFDL
ncbi:MAG: TonB-dependent receptor [Candidatus Aminicenantes bacterium]|nr:MAG: TonB-dependent receptor [Candidatus Aminicenantes bacterium]